MILLLDRKIVILTPPKTASDSLHRLFCSGPPWNGQQVSSHHNGTHDKHGLTPPNEAAGCRILLAVRHPFDRLVSLWHHQCRCQAFHGRASRSFADYAKSVAAGDEKTWIWGSSICQLLGDQHYDGLVRFEALHETLAGHGLEVPRASIPRVNESYRKPWREYFTPELLDGLTPWAAADCERFGYSTQ